MPSRQQKLTQANRRPTTSKSNNYRFVNRSQTVLQSRPQTATRGITGKQNHPRSRRAIPRPQTSQPGGHKPIVIRYTFSRISFNNNKFNINMMCIYRYAGDPHHYHRRSGYTGGKSIYYPPTPRARIPSPQDWPEPSIHPLLPCPVIV